MSELPKPPPGIRSGVVYPKDKIPTMPQWPPCQIVNEGVGGAELLFPMLAAVIAIAFGFLMGVAVGRGYEQRMQLEKQIAVGDCV